MTRRIQVIHTGLGSCLWWGIFTTVSWAHPGHGHSRDSGGELWSLLVRVAVGVGFVLIWVVSRLHERRQRNRS